MSEIYGAKYVLLLCVAGSAIINLATPWMARNSFALLVVSRIIMGAIQSGVFPGMYALIAKWLTMSEASIYAPMVKMCLRLGMLLGSLTIGFLPPEWPIVFYFTGAVSAVWSLLWLLIATSNPADNKWVSKVELAHIMKKKRQPPAIANEDVELGQIGGGTNSKPARAKKTPWLKILTSPSVIGLVLVKLASNYALDFLAIELPSYLNYVHHASTQTVCESFKHKLSSLESAKLMSLPSILGELNNDKDVRYTSCTCRVCRLVGENNGQEAPTGFDQDCNKEDFPSTAELRCWCRLLPDHSQRLQSDLCFLDAPDHILPHCIHCWWRNNVTI